jgi:hypothetical protein
MIIVIIIIIVYILAAAMINIVQPARDTAPPQCSSMKQSIVPEPTTNTQALQ